MGLGSWGLCPLPGCSPRHETFLDRCSGGGARRVSGRHRCAGAGAQQVGRAAVIARRGFCGDRGGGGVVGPAKCDLEAEVSLLYPAAHPAMRPSLIAAVVVLHAASVAVTAVRAQEPNKWVVPPGFHVTVFAHNVEGARSMALGPHG